jgi:protoheme IX farnesyltransferase
MSTSTLVRLQADRNAGIAARLSDYLELTKPRILTMVLMAIALSGVIATWGQPDLPRLIHTLIGTTLVAASASIFNQWLERSADARMHRTHDRPLPTQRLGHFETLSIGTVTVLTGLAYLLNFAGRVPALFAAATWLLYVGAYTPLKTRTWLNTVVGAVAGALPVLIGWAGAGGQFNLRCLCVLLLVFLWQFPHFMAIAWIYRHQYQAANMRMLTVVDPSGRRAGVQAVVAAFSVLVVSLIPGALSIAVSPVYMLASLALGLGQFYCATGFWRARTDVQARRLLRASLIYLPSQLGLITLLSLALI